MFEVVDFFCVKLYVNIDFEEIRGEQNFIKVLWGYCGWGGLEDN